MDLEKQVCSVELSKRLNKLGVLQDSIFYWQFFPGHNFIIHDKDKAKNYKTDTYSAYTVAELGEMLKLYQDGFTCVWYEDKYIAFDKYLTPFWQNDGEEISDETEANVRAKTLIHLIDNNLIEITK